jgi:hypothetical protein
MVEDFIAIQLKEFDIYDEDREEITLANRSIKSQLYGEMQLTRTRIFTYRTTIL